MALELKLSDVQSNDSKILQLTDVSGIYSLNNEGGWGTPNPSVTDIDGVTHTLTLDITSEGIDDADTVYDTIDLYDVFGPFSTTDDLVFNITADLLVNGGTAVGTSDDVIPDGVYTIIYTYDKGLGTEVSLQGTLLVDGVVRTETYRLLSNIPDVYNCTNYKSNKIDFAIFAYSYLQSMQSAAYLAKIDDILRNLETLQKLIRNGNNSVN